MSIRDFASKSAVLGLRGGGQIAKGMLSEYTDSALIKLYLDSRMLRLSVFMDQVQDQAWYTVPAIDVDDLESESRLIQLNRVSYSDPDAPSQETINSTTVIGRDRYSFKSSVTATNTIERALKFHSAPGADVKMGLELVRACSSKSDEYVPPEVETDARDALTALVKHLLLSETGKPWHNPDLARLEMSLYLIYMAKIKMSAETDFTQRDLTATSAVPFII